MHIRQGDFVLIFTCEPFTLTSDVSTIPVDSEAVVAEARNVRLTLGQGEDRPVTLHAGKFIFDTANEDLLAGLLPPVVHIGADDASLGPVRALLTMNEMEARRPGPASEFIIVRLVELILVEILRTRQLRIGEEETGLLAGLADAGMARALAAMHQNLAHDWTVGELARLSGVSRSAFAARFRRIVGKGTYRVLAALAVGPGQG